MSAEPDVADPDALLSADSVPQIRVAQMRRVDELMVDAFGVGLAQMMENAGRSLAELAEVRFAPRSVTVLAGAGNNGGGGLVAARHLANHGVRVRVVMAALPVPGSLVEGQLTAAVACGVVRVDDPEAGDVVIDALVGYGLAVRCAAGWPSSLGGRTVSPRLRWRSTGRPVSTWTPGLRRPARSGPRPP